MDNIMTVRLHEVGKVSAAVREPATLAAALGEAVIVERAMLITTTAHIIQR